jgi:type II secretion system protein I
MRRSAFTLFEVLLALAILVGAIATLGELLRGGLISAERARDLSRATLICEGKMAQIVAGAQLPETVTRIPVEDDLTGEWIYSVEVTDTASPYLLSVRVTVQRDVPDEKNPVTSTLVRWVKSPFIETATGSSDTGSSTSSSSSSSTGGTQ